MATTTPQRIVVTIPPDIVGHEVAMQRLRDGLCNAASEPGLDAFDNIPEEALDSDYGHPSFFPWDKLVDEAVDSIAPKVAQMLEDAIADRLPFTWEGEDR